MSMKRECKQSAQLIPFTASYGLQATIQNTSLKCDKMNPMCALYFHDQHRFRYSERLEKSCITPSHASVVGKERSRMVFLIDDNVLASILYSPYNVARALNH